ncbi:ISAs1 family transposase [Salmonella enterica]
MLVLLDTLNINGVLISVDAMNTQKKIADKIISRGADYVLCVKNNHRELRNEIAAYFTKVSRDTPEYLARYEETDAGHGEQRSGVTDSSGYVCRGFLRSQTPPGPVTKNTVPERNRSQ